jgi:long-chain acyl-CoA synthetase
MSSYKLYEFLEQYCVRFPKKNIFYAKEQGNWTPYSCEKVLATSKRIAVALNKMGIGWQDGSVEGRDKIAMISANRPEWCMVDYGSQMCGAVLVPVYPSININELSFILNDAHVKVLFVEDKKLFTRLSNIKELVPSLKEIFFFEETEGQKHWSELTIEYTAQEYQTVEFVHKTMRPEDLGTIIYTSGTTGNPKGVMLSHKNISSNVQKCVPLFTMCDENGIALSFLPLNHIFEKMVMSIYIAKGISIYFAEDVSKVGDNLREIKPDLFTTVPRLLEKVYERIMDKGNELSGAKKKIFDWALKVAEKYDGTNQGFIYNIQRKIADKLVFSKWREALGGNVKAIITGSAACQMRLQKLFTCANVIIMEGYGLTETSPVVTVNNYEADKRSFGTIGVPLPGQEIKLAPDGEILCKGDHVMMGYYKNPEMTAEVMQDGWFMTGDIATWIDNKFLKITDRKKELFKLSAGKYIAPQVLENKIKESPYIEQIMVVGSDEKFVGALIVPNINNLKDYLVKKGVEVSDDKVAIVNAPEIQKLIRTELNSLNKNFSEHEHVKRFQLLPEEWTIDTGEMTPTLKLKRKVIVQKYSHLIQKIFNLETKAG